MTARWGSCVIVAICLALCAGCRTPQPVLKPTAVKEQYVSPPREDRYDVAGYPTRAFDKLEDPMRRGTDPRMNPGVMRAGGTSTNMGMPGR
jgi:hypothetical protein